jgi:hypothetical protein
VAARKVAYAALRYTTQHGAVVFAHRGEIIDLNAEEAKRYDAMGAVVKADEELVLLGNLVPLNESASDVQITNYLLSGNVGEIRTQLETYPLALVDKLLTTERADRKRPQLIADMEKLLGKEPTVTIDNADGSSPSGQFVPPPPVGTPEPLVDPSAASTGTPTEDTFDAAAVLKGTVQDVLAYAAEHPEHREALLAAEQSEDGQKRKGVLEGLEAPKA